MSQTIVCFGEMLLRLSAPGKEFLLQSSQFAAHVGGAEANVAVSLARLGHRSAMVTVLPDSPLGSACRDELRKHGVDTHAIQFRPGRMGLYFLTHGAGQRPAEVLYDRADSAFAVAPAEIYAWHELLSSARWLHVTGITPALSDSCARATRLAMQAARSAGVQISFDCNFRPRLWGNRASEAPQLLRGLCEQADLLFGDERDVAFMLGFKGDSTQQDYRRRAADAAFNAFPHLQWLACTQRLRQSADVQQIAGLLFGKHDTYNSRPYPLHGIVDRIGAGDAYAAGLLHGLLRGFEPQKLLDFATAAACLKHSIPGDFNLAGAAEIELVLSEQPMDVRR